MMICVSKMDSEISAMAVELLSLREQKSSLLEAAKAALYLMDQIDALEMERERNQLRSAIEQAEGRDG